MVIATTTTSRPAQVPQAQLPKLPPLPQDQLSIGAKGDNVKLLQQRLKDLGFPVEVDGKFGKATADAVKAFQKSTGCKVDGIVGPETHGALAGQSSAERASARDARNQSARTVGGDTTPNAPTQEQRQQRPPGTQRAGDVAQSDQARAAKNAGASSVVQPVPPGPADDRLAQIQARVMNSARTELDKGVREDKSIGDNRGRDIDGYAKNAGMAVGGEWCGYFATHNYTQAAKAEGFDFAGRHRMHSMEKARSFFMYGNYTDNSAKEKGRNADLKAKHTEEGSARRFMTFEGGHGDKFARSNNMPHETYKGTEIPIRAGDTVLFHDTTKDKRNGHIAQVESYDPASGKLVTIEGNAGEKVSRREYDLNDPKVRAKIEGIGRPALGDFHSTTPR